jgi:hypothetical protein
MTPLARLLTAAQAHLDAPTWRHECALHDAIEAARVECPDPATMPAADFEHGRAFAEYVDALVAELALAERVRPVHSVRWFVDARPFVPPAAA